MTKPDFPALLAPGVHVHTLSSLEAVAVKPFNGDPRRAMLFQQFQDWVTALQTAKLTGRLWIDGSFLTEKPGPDDIDCVMWCPQLTGETSPLEQMELGRLMDRAIARTLYCIDFYLEMPSRDDLIHREAYWKGFFGYCHDRTTAKGFAEVHI